MVLTVKEHIAAGGWTPYHERFYEIEEATVEEKKWRKR
jgi:hypothetical protein